MLDEFGTDRPEDYIAGFPPHPHRGFETVTQMLDGHTHHEDQMGNVGELTEGDGQSDCGKTRDSYWQKLRDYSGANHRACALRDLEKDQVIDTVDIVAGENRQPAYLAKNPGGQSPCIETDDGQHIAEITALCAYVDEKFPGQSLIGDTAQERASNRM